jgi:hypothetical protein
MTETTFPFQGAPPEAEGAGAAGPEEQLESGNRRPLVLLAALGAVGLLAVLGYLLLFSGGDEAAEEPVPSAAGQDAGDGVGAQPPAEDAAPADQPRLSKKNFGKDPFAPLIVEPEAVAGGEAPVTGTTGTTGTATDPSGVTVTVVDPATTGTGTTTGGTTTGGTDPGTGTGTASPDPVRIKVVSVAKDNFSGRVVVDGKTYSVAVGDVFAQYFKALRFKNGRCGAFQYGDERFDLCEGDTARMQ